MIAGHSHVIEHLKKLADARRLSHGCLFFGPPRVGKRTVALAFARYLETGTFDPPEASRAPGLLYDAQVILPDETGTIGIEAIRAARSFLWQRPVVSPYRTVVVSDAEQMTTEAQSALLKIAEEPPHSALLLVVARDPANLLPTVASRLTKWYFGLVAQPEIETWLMHGVGVSGGKARAAAKKAFGAPGLAWAYLNDEDFQALQKEAALFLGLSPAERRTFVKDLAANEAFSADAFLEALMIHSMPACAANLALWQRLLKLRREMTYYNLNPRLQLTALAENLESGI